MKGGVYRMLTNQRHPSGGISKEITKNKTSLTCPRIAQSGTGHQKEKEYDRNSD